MGCRYLYGYNHPYTVEEHKIRYGDIEMPLEFISSNGSEHGRTVDMMNALETKYGDQYVIQLFFDSSNYSPFCVGGDIGTLKKDFTAAVLLQGSGGSEEQTAELEPPSQMEILTSPQQSIPSSPQEAELDSPTAESSAQHQQNRVSTGVER